MHIQKPKLMPLLSTYHHLLLFLLILHHAPPCPAAGGSWSLLLENTGVSAMHMQLLPNDRVIIFDRADFGNSNISLPKGKCRPTINDCSAHSVEYDVVKNTIRPVYLETDVWCSSGTLMPQGNLVQTGGNGDGGNVVRLYNSCDTCDWQEIPNGLLEGRWYATNHLLPDGRQIIIGGRNQFNYEFFPKSPKEPTYDLPFLNQTSDPEENNLYPYVFLNPDGNLIIFANDRGILLDYSTNKIVKTYPPMPGGQPRNYPSTGSAVLLPLNITGGVAGGVEVLICGGAPKNAFFNAFRGKFDGALDTCGRIKVSDPEPKWVMERMPMARLMGDMVLLPNGHVLIINGASNGVAGWQIGNNPVLKPVIYRPYNQLGSRFEVQNASTIPRMYHSTAILLKDGRILVGGSNPNDKYTFQNIPFRTELRMEAYSPPYLDSCFNASRPNIIPPKNALVMKYGKPVVISFTVAGPGPVDPKTVWVAMKTVPFNTHSFSMNQRLLVLDSRNSTRAVGKNRYRVSVTAPPSGTIAPPGYYIIHVIHKEIPSPGMWVTIQR